MMRSSQEEISVTIIRDIRELSAKTTDSQPPDGEEINCWLNHHLWYFMAARGAIVCVKQK